MLLMIYLWLLYALMPGKEFNKKFNINFINPGPLAKQNNKASRSICQYTDAMRSPPWLSLVT